MSRLAAVLLALSFVTGPVYCAEDAVHEEVVSLDRVSESAKRGDAGPTDNNRDAGEKEETADSELLSPDRALAQHSPLVERWELAPETKQGTFKFRPHGRVYMLPFRYSTSPNEQPESPRTGSPAKQDYDNTEVKFQLSFKIKTLEGLFGDHADLWFALTQQSSWQLYNAGISRPFRETNYEPEIILTFATDYEFLGLKGRLLNIGLVHQSNGQSDPLSRSWNRVYVQLGWERGNFTLLARPWYRIPDAREKDDNRDIDEFLGYGDLQAIYKRDRHTLSLEVRSNLRSAHHGSLQADYTFGSVGQMLGYVQVFTGYGESMIDYNHRQTTIGIGLLLIDTL